MTISVQNSSDDSHLAASIEPAITVSMVGTNSKAVISVQNSSDDSHLAASIEPVTTASMVGTNSKAVSCISDVQISSRSHICLGRAPGVWCVVAVHTLLHLCQNTRWSNIRGEYPARGIDIRGLGPCLKAASLLCTRIQTACLKAAVFSDLLHPNACKN